MPTPIPAATSWAAALTLVQMQSGPGFCPAEENHAIVLRYIEVGGGVVTTVKLDKLRGDAPIRLASAVVAAQTLVCGPSGSSRKVRSPTGSTRTARSRLPCDRSCSSAELVVTVHSGRSSLY